MVCCLYTRSDHRPPSGAVVRKASPCDHTRNSIKPCLSSVPPRRCCSSHLRGGKSREARLKSMQVDVCCACPEVGPGPLQKATRDQTYLAHFFQGYSSLLLPVSLSSCSVLQPRCASRGMNPSFVRMISHAGPLTRDTILSIVILCKRYTSIDCAGNGSVRMDNPGDVLGFLVDGREQNGEESYGSCSLSDSGG